MLIAARQEHAGVTKLYLNSVRPILFNILSKPISKI